MDLTVNGESRAVDVDPATPLLDVLRNDLGLLGAKRGCDLEQCYACAVLVDGRTQPSCRLPVGYVAETPVLTVESAELDPLREFFLAEQAGQCAFCIAGMLVAAEGLLGRIRRPNDRQIREALDTNLCRCGVYDRVRRAIRFRIGEPDEPIWQVRPQPPIEGSVDPVTSGPAANPSLAAFPDVDSWLAIDDEETVTIFSGKAELGQGIATALVAVAAGELSLDPERIRLVGPDTARTPDEGVTSGSRSVETSVAAIRAATRTAAALLLTEAGAVLGVSAAGLVVQDGVVRAVDLGRHTSYWELRGGRSFGLPVDPDAAPVWTGTAADRSIDGSGGDRPTRVDLPAKVAGRPSYVHDLRLPGTVHGRVVRPPGFSARLDHVDTDEVGAMPGVIRVVVDGSFVAVVAERERQAVAAARALADAAKWTGSGPLPDPFDQLRHGASRTYDVIDGLPVDHRVGSPTTDPARGFDVSARYTKPFTLHGALGPSAAVARSDGADLTVWSHTQGVFPLRAALAQVLDRPVGRIRVIHVDGPGCYGHNGADDVALDAALMAVSVPGRPVLVSWSRADEHRWEPWGPAMVVELHADLDGDRIAAFESENWSYSHTARPRHRDDGTTDLLAGWHRAEPLDRPTPRPNRVRHVGAHRNSDPLYRIGRRRVRTHLSTTTDYRTSALRALGAYANVFAIESFVDELAAAVDADPVAFRLANLDDPRALAVIEAAADEAGWDPTRSSADGTGRGIGFARYKNQQTYLAVVVDVTVDRLSGSIEVERATIAADAGRIVHPDGLSNQLEGGCVQAASWTLIEAVGLGSTGVLSDDWDSYPILRFSRSFPVRTVLLDRPDQPSLGCGEAAQGPSAAAIANAAFDAVGIRLRDLPLTPGRVSTALDTTATTRPTPP